MEPLKEVIMDRTYDAPIATVWQAWTNADQLKQWWGPDNVTIPTCEIDPKVGGKFHIVMEAGEAMGPYKGTLWPMTAEFTEVEPNSKLAYTAQAWTEGQKEETTIETTTEINFTEEDGKTKVHIRSAIFKAGPGAAMAAEGMQYGFAQQMEKLNTFLAGK